MKSDEQIWEDLFKTIPDGWKEAEPSLSMHNCYSLLSSHNTRNVLDMGCGPGLWSVFLATKGFSVYSVDFSENAIAFARKWANELSLRIKYEVGSVEQDHFSGTRFDGIICAKILENISEDKCKKTIKLAYQKLNSSGVVYALFNPLNYDNPSDDSPLSGSTFHKYSDEKIEDLFDNFKLLSKNVVEFEFREFLFKKDN
ncbi:MAG: class I SAM-dependent methyltransferase [Cyclobacteriaceae bacterium]